MKVALDFEICEHNKISNFLMLRKQPHKQANDLTGNKVVQACSESRVIERSSLIDHGSLAIKLYPWCVFPTRSLTCQAVSLFTF